MWLELDRRVPSEILARGLIETCRARAAQSALSAECLSDVSAAEVGLGDVLLRADQPAQARALYEKSLATRERIVAEFGETAETAARRLGIADQGRRRAAARRSASAGAALYEKSLATCKRIVAEVRRTAAWLRDVSVSQSKGRRRAAAPISRRRRGRCRKVARHLRAHRRRVRRDGRAAARRLGIADQGRRRAAARRSAGAGAGATKSRSPPASASSPKFGRTPERLRDVSVSQDRVGDVLLRADQPAQAQALYEKSLATRERIVAEFGETAENGCADVSLSRDRVGDDAAARRSASAERGRCTKKSLATCRRIVAGSADGTPRLRDVSLSQIRVGDVLLRADQPAQARAL